MSDTLREHTISPAIWFGGGGLFGAIGLSAWGAYQFSVTLPPGAVIALSALTGMTILCLLAAGREYYIREGIRIDNEHLATISVAGASTDRTNAATLPGESTARKLSAAEEVPGGVTWRDVEAQDLERRRLRVEIEEREEKLRIARGGTSLTYQSQKDAYAKKLAFGDTSIEAFDAQLSLVIVRDGGYSEWDTSTDGLHLEGVATALVARFRPKSLSSSPAFVTARIDYYDANIKRIAVVNYGCWLGETTRSAEFSVSDTQDLIIVLRSRGGDYAVDDKRDDVVHERGVTLLPLALTQGFARVHGVIEVGSATGVLGDSWFAFDSQRGDGKEATISLLSEPPSKSNVEL